MTPTEFRERALRHAPSLSAFARLLSRLGWRSTDLFRTVQRYASGERETGGAIEVILTLLDRDTVQPPPPALAVSQDRDGPCGEAIDPHLDALAERAEAAGWHPAETTAAVLSWCVNRAHRNAGADATVQMLEDAAEVVRLS